MKCKNVRFRLLKPIIAVPAIAAVGVLLSTSDFLRENLGTVVPFDLERHAHAAEVSGNPVNANITASRASGPAPLAVNFDASVTTHSNADIDTFRDLGYRFSFDDPSAGTWVHSGENKNTEVGGPIAAHVFETPGVYSVAVRAEDSAGNQDSGFVTITVTDPNVVYSGTDTICVSQTSSFNDCPPGAELRATLPAWSTINNKRVLLRRGETFSGDLSIGQVQDWQLGAYGSGVAPVVDNVYIESGNPENSGLNFVERGAVMDLNLDNVLMNNSMQDVLVLRNTVRASDPGLAIGVGLTTRWYYQNTSSQSLRDALYYPINIFIVENTADAGNTTSYVVFGNGNGVSLLGNEFHNTNQHNVRFSANRKAIIGHNYFHNPGDTQQLIKFNGGATNDYDVLLNQALTFASEDVVIANNLLGDGNEDTPWLVSISPQNDIELEAVENVIFEQNTVNRSGNVSSVLQLGGRNLTERVNIVQQGSSLDIITSVFAAGIPLGWDGPYYTGVPLIEPTVDDTDDDGVADDMDNCTLVANPDQLDSNLDGFGNACDIDLNNDCIVNMLDFVMLSSVFLTDDADADFNGDGIVNLIDFSLVPPSFLQPPGPAVEPNACTSN